MKCPRCGSNNPMESSFCKDCGNSLSGYTAGGPTQQGMVSFPDAVKLGLQRYLEFGGRSTRAEYWWWALFNAIVVLTATLIDGLIGTYPLMYGICALGLFLPSLAVSVRRLHDTNKTGWWFLMALVPFGGIVLLVFFVLGSDKEINKYGPPGAEL
jgi:uncharacterized membrane protein YhaH (DUF805 family)